VFTNVFVSCVGKWLEVDIPTQEYELKEKSVRMNWRPLVLCLAEVSKCGFKRKRAKEEELIQCIMDSVNKF
jgi:hypothetical protein